MAKADNGIGLAELTCTSDVAPLAVVTPTTRSMWPSASRTCPTHNVSGRPSQSRSLTLRWDTSAGGEAPVGAQPPAANDRAEGTVNSAATNSDTSSARRIELHRVQSEHRAAPGQGLEFLGPPGGDQPRSLHESDPRRHLGREGPQYRPRVFGRQLHHPDPLDVAAPGHR